MAEIIQFVPRPNPKRSLTEIEEALVWQTLCADPVYIPTDCGNAIWPWPEKDGA